MKNQDTLRIRQEISIASNKPNMEEIIWSGIELRGVDSRISEGRIDVNGEALVQVLYLAAEDEERLQWFETTVPLKGSIDCDVCNQEQLYHITAQMADVHLDVAPDMDGEARNLYLEVILQMHI